MKEILIITFINQKSILNFKKCFITTEGYKNPCLDKSNNKENFKFS